MTKGLKRPPGRSAQDTSEVFHEIEQKIKFYIHRETDIHRVDKVKIEKRIESVLPTINTKKRIIFK